MQAATRTWTGADSATNILWSNAGNWDAGLTSGVDAALFTVSTAVANKTPINSTVGADISLESLTIEGAASSTKWQNIQINSGATLSLGTATGSTNVLFLGTTASKDVTQATISGAGALQIDKSGGLVQVGQGATSSGNNGSGALDMSGLASLTVDLGTIGTFRLGALNAGGNGATGGTGVVVSLATTSQITAGTLSLGSETGSSGLHKLLLGNGTNTLRFDTIDVGAGNNITALRGSGEISFGSSSGSVQIRAANGTGRAVLNLVNGQSSTGGGLTSTVDFRGHSADLLISALTIARRTGVGAGLDSNSTFSFDTGTLDVTTINVGELAGAGTNGTSVVQGTINLGSSGSTGTSTIGSLTLATSARNNATSSATATMNVAGGTHTVTGNITMSNTTVASALATSTLNLTGGTLKVEGNIAEGTSTGTSNSTITLNGGILDMDAGTITVDTFDLQSGTLKNLAEFNGGAALTKTTAGSLTLAGSNSYHGNTLVSAGSLILADNATMAFYIGANGVTNSLNGTGSLLLDGDFVFNLSGAAAVDGNSWQIVNVGTLSETFSGTFTVQGFTKQGSVWSSGNYQFSELTGTLSYLTVIPEPSIGMLMGLSVLFLTTLRRKGS